MLCQKCQERPATVFFSQTINNQTTQMHLCEVCAREANPMTGGVDLANPLAELTNLLNAVMGMDVPLQGMPQPKGVKPRINPELQCPHCGYQLSVFKQTGRLGCTKCYEAFRQALEPVVTGIHGPVRHMEETNTAATMTADDLREKLQEAIKKERFEEAARLRDQIKKLGEN